MWAYNTFGLHRRNITAGYSDNGMARYSKPPPIEGRYKKWG